MSTATPSSRATSAVVFTACDSAYRAALDLKAGGVNIAVIADIRKAPQGPWIDRARSGGIDVRTGTVITATQGRLRVSSATLAKLDDFGRTSGARRDRLRSDPDVRRLYAERASVLAVARQADL